MFGQPLDPYSSIYRGIKGKDKANIPNVELFRMNKQFLSNKVVQTQVKRLEPLAVGTRPGGRQWQLLTDIATTATGRNASRVGARADQTRRLQRVQPDDLFAEGVEAQLGAALLRVQENDERGGEVGARLRVVKGLVQVDRVGLGVRLAGAGTGGRGGGELRGVVGQQLLDARVVGLESDAVGDQVHVVEGLVVGA